MVSFWRRNMQDQLLCQHQVRDGTLEKDGCLFSLITRSSSTTTRATVCSPCSHLESDTGGSASIPPDYGAVSSLRLWHSLTHHLPTNRKHFSIYLVSRVVSFCPCGCLFECFLYCLFSLKTRLVALWLLLMMLHCICLFGGVVKFVLRWSACLLLQTKSTYGYKKVIWTWNDHAVVSYVDNSCRFSKRYTETFVCWSMYPKLLTELCFCILTDSSITFNFDGLTFLMPCRSPQNYYM